MGAKETSFDGALTRRRLHQVRVRRLHHAFRPQSADAPRRWWCLPAGGRLDGGLFKTPTCLRSIQSR